MKEPIEELFKQSLKGHEMPYNPAAWKTMSAKLDAAQPVAAPKSNVKYYLGAAGIGAAAIATYFFFAGGDVPTNTENPITAKTTTKETTITKKDSKNEPQEVNTETNSSVSNTSENNSTVSNNSVNEVESHFSTVITGDDNRGSASETSTNTGSNNEHGSTTSTSTLNQNENHETSTNNSTVVEEKKVVLPTMNDLCLNESVSINNQNEVEIYLLDAIGNVIKTIPAKKTAIFQPEIVGNYALAFNNEGSMKSGSNFQVNRIPDADFTVDLINKFDKGLPTTHVEGISRQGTYIWKADGQVSNGVQADLHFYEKGNQTIELTVNNGQCETTVEKSVYVENDYNLMAVNSFTPTSTQPSNTTFIPFALTQRDVKFEMTIIDGRDGGIVYKTSDASLPWDGTDIRSGRRSETPQVYVWKVVIFNPAPNEPGEYVGTITMN